MLGHAPFYNQSIKNTVSAFGSLFNNISIIREKGTNTQTVKVPLAYASKDKAFIRRTVDPTLNYNIETTYPRMGFILTGVSYDSTRKLLPGNFKQKNGGDVAFASPYNLDFELYIGTTNIEDSLQIVEQILPFFSPEFTLSVKDFPTLSRDVPVVLNSSSYIDPAIDSDFSETRLVEWTLSFTAKTYLYGPQGMGQTGPKIKKVDVFVFENELNFNNFVGE